MKRLSTVIGTKPVSRLSEKDSAQARTIAAALKPRAHVKRKPLLFTGKNASVAVEAVANELRLDLYRVDLAAVVGKTIGETEKNLDLVFSEAEQAGAILLLLDQADALFGKRTEAKNAHDRYANLEVSRLLQRMEEFGGIVIVTSRSKPRAMAALRRFSVYGFPPT
jgi:SpoVK/Ycf46/Vps4 family AAA+-type ATPase